MSNFLGAVQLSDEQVAALRPLIEREPATVAAFLTARRHGYKIIAYLGSVEAEQLRGAYLQEETIAYERLEENLYIYFRPAKPGDYLVKWKPAAAILSYLSGMGRTQANAQSQQLLIQLLERDGFMKRVNPNGITEYGVLVLTLEEVENNAKRIE